MVEPQPPQGQMTAEAFVFHLRPWRIAAALWAASFVVVGAGLFREWFISTYGTDTIAQDLRHLAFDAEYCLPAWYSSMLLLGSAALLALVTASSVRRGERFVLHWAALAVIFLGLSIDEATGIHEVLIKPLRNGLGLSGFFYFGWVLPGLAVVAAVGLAYVPFLFAQPRRTKYAFATAGLFYVGGALGMEMIGGKALTTYGVESLAYRAAFCLEETMEIVGATLFATALLGHLKRRFGGAFLLVA